MKRSARSTTLALLLLASACGDSGPIAFVSTPIGDFEEEKQKGQSGSAGSGGSGSTAGRGGSSGSSGSAGRGGSSGYAGSAGRGGSSGFGGSVCSGIEREHDSSSCDDCMRVECCGETRGCDLDTPCDDIERCRERYCLGLPMTLVANCVMRNCDDYGEEALSDWITYRQCMYASCSSECE